MTDVDEGAVLVNGQPLLVRAASLRGLLEDLKLDPERPGLAVALNDEVVPRSEWHSTAVRPGDRIEVVSAVAGG